MLSLTRRIGERIMIGGEGGVPLITITLSRIRGNQATYSVECPREVPVYREEIYNRILNENRALRDSKGE